MKTKIKIAIIKKLNEFGEKQKKNVRACYNLGALFKNYLLICFRTALCYLLYCWLILYFNFEILKDYESVLKQTLKLIVVCILYCFFSVIAAVFMRLCYELVVFYIFELFYIIELSFLTYLILAIAHDFYGDDMFE